MNEYQVYQLDPRYELAHMGPVLFETDCLAFACTFCYNKHKLDGTEVCVFQPRTGYYREYYKNEEKTDLDQI